MKKIGLFGGTFDPWTKAHQAIVDGVLESKMVDMVIILPTIVDYHRNGKDKWLSDTDKFKVLYKFIESSKTREIYSWILLKYVKRTLDNFLRKR